MRRVIVSTYVTLDGIMDALEEWHFRFLDEEARGYARDRLFSSDALLTGLETYKGFVAYWPTSQRSVIGRDAER